MFDADEPREAVPSFDRMYPVLARLRRHAPRTIADFEQALALGRRFRREVVEPNALAIERRVAADPTWVAEDVLVQAARYGLFGSMIPRLFGGGGRSFGAMTIALEEIAAGCLGLANLIAVHGLALCSVAATGDLAALERICRIVTTSERAGRPRLLSTAITEPSAGTDVEDVELLRKARLVTEAKPVRGGYLLNGRKVFISNGSIAATHVVIAPTDRSRPVETTFGFLIDTGARGFRVGRVERKMGQKACPAAELIFEDCFVPEADRVGRYALPGRRIDLVLGATRGAVGAFGAGVARGAYERARRYARSHKARGRWLIDQQWVQLKLADMLRNVMIARAAYIDAMISNELFGLAARMGSPGDALLARVPQELLDLAPISRLLASPSLRERGEQAIDAIPEPSVDAASSFGAASKITGTDLGIANCHLALDLLGADGLRHDAGVEKLFRDAKLLQIYEGTNQLNRIELFKKGVDPGRVVVKERRTAARIAAEIAEAQITPRARRRRGGANASGANANGANANGANAAKEERHGG